MASIEHIRIQCTGPCQRWLSQTTEYFWKDKERFRRQCKLCMKSLQKTHEEAHPELIKARARKYHQRWLEKHPEQQEKNRENVAEYNRLHPEYGKNYREKNKVVLQVKRLQRWKEHPEREAEYREKNREDIRRKGREYYAKNSDKSHSYYLENKEDIVVKRRRYRIEKKDTLALRNKRWRENNPEQVRINIARRKAKKLGLPHDFCLENNQFARTYWYGCCAICGRENGLWYLICLDHFIPLANPECPGTVAVNMLPLCHAKKGMPVGMESCCNNSKGAKDPVSWLTEKLGTRKAQAKLRAIEAFFVAAKVCAERYEQRVAD